MELIVTPQGMVRALYGEEIPLETLGPPSIARASMVEPEADGRWRVDLAPVGGPRLGPFARRSQALRAEVEWLAAHGLPEVPINSTTNGGVHG